MARHAPTIEHVLHWNDYFVYVINLISHASNPISHILYLASRIPDQGLNGLITVLFVVFIIFDIILNFFIQRFAEFF
jgi:hypothetical protein